VSKRGWGDMVEGPRRGLWKIKRLRERGKKSNGRKNVIN